MRSVQLQLKLVRDVCGRMDSERAGGADLEPWVKGVEYDAWM